MKPALSVILFTVLSGAGLGALALLAIADLISMNSGNTWLSRTSATVVSVIALVLVIIGLGASTLHLANPRNAWRSLARWHTSWLSREASAALLFIPLAAAYAAMHAFEIASPRGALAVAVLVLAWVMLYCTAMIYASLKPIRQWHTPRVPLTFWLLAHASGALLVVAALSAEQRATRAWIIAAFALFVLALVAKLEYWRFVGNTGGGVPLGRAIGVDHGVGPPRSAQNDGRAAGDARTVAARILDTGHSKGTFLTHEFLHTPRESTRRTLRTVAIVAGFAVPMLWLGFGRADWRDGAVAFAVCLIGLIAERWLFFAEARHTVRLYHGDART